MTLRTGRWVLETEARAVEALARRLDHRFDEAVRILSTCEGRAVLTGMGKSGIVARKISATMASTGTPSFFLHPAEAAHGDIGMVREGDAVVALSNSGETREILEILAPLKRLGVPLIAMTKPGSTLAREADVALDASVEEEASPVPQVPTASTTAAMALGDALAVAVFERRGFDAEEFRLYHPGGEIGKGLRKVSELMHSGAALPVCAPRAPLREALAVMSGKKFGHVLAAEGGKLAGILSDGDLRRFLQKGGDVSKFPLAEAMVRSPKTLLPSQTAAEALRLMEAHKITALPVVDAEGSLLGLVHLHDLWKVQLF
jgi:arabinose-5-phosphate isomerase